MVDTENPNKLKGGRRRQRGILRKGLGAEIIPLFYQRLKLKFDILVAYEELIRDFFLAELLSAKAANNHLSGSRSCSSGLHHLWESGQGPRPQYKDCLKPVLFL